MCYSLSTYLSAISAPFHTFPNDNKYPHEEKFNSWKAVLDEVTLAKGNSYIINSVRICGEHFEGKYRSPSRRLTANAIPTLNLRKFFLIY